jgi:hypothetical protein
MVKSTINHLNTYLLLEPATFGSIRRLEDHKAVNLGQLAIARAAMRGLAEAESYLSRDRHHR